MAPVGLEELLRGQLRAPLALQPTEDTPHAAVAVVLAGPALEVALIRRAENPLDPWSGQMALPGGRRSPADPNLMATAARETHEEIGIDLTPATLWGALPELPTATGRLGRSLLVAPFVYRLEELPLTTPNEEVAEVLWVPAQRLLDGPPQTRVEYQHVDRIFHFPAWDLDGRVVWGLTHRILSSLFSFAPTAAVAAKWTPEDADFEA